MFPPKIHIATKEYVLISTTNHFITLDRKRRIGMEYWIALRDKVEPFKDVETVILAQYTLSKNSATKWILAMVQQGRVYISKSTYDFTLKVAQELTANEKTKE